MFDLRHHTATSGIVKLDELSISSPNRQLGHAYEPTRARALRHYLRTCEFPPESVFVDLGCGKGRALLVASHFAFKRVVGVEFSRELCDIARSNAQAHQRWRSDLAPVDVVQSDAAVYEIRPDENVFFMFNPFGEEVLRRVVQNLSTHAARHGQPAWVICNNLLYPGAVESTGTFARQRIYKYGSSAFAEYTSLRP
jgi:predicted RNA methylase